MDGSVIEVDTFQDTNEDPYVAVARGGKIHFLGWSWAESELFSWPDGPYKLKPDTDRWGNSEARNFKHAIEPWDSLSGSVHQISLQRIKISSKSLISSRYGVYFLHRGISSVHVFYHSSFTS